MADQFLRPPNGEFASPSFPSYPSAGVAAVSGALASNGVSAAFTPTAGRPAYLELTGAGSATVTLEYECADGSFAPRGFAVDGNAPSISGRIAYSGVAQNGLVVEFKTTIAGQKVRVKPGTVTGAVNFAFRQ